MISKNQIKEVKTLHLKKHRDAQKLFIAEGIKIVSEIILAKPELLLKVYATTEFVNQNSNIISSQIPLEVVSNDELNKISNLTTPNQVLAVCKYFEKPILKFDLTKSFSLYLDDIRDPGNLGTILRLADWIGLKDIYASPNSTEIYNPKVIQAAMGAFLRVHVHSVLLTELVREAKFPIYGALMNGKNIYKEKFQNGLIVIGNEANGIQPENLKLITHPITIPAHASNQTESLNAAIATSIICSEFNRQINFT